jgi:hypothetical protein
LRSTATTTVQTRKIAPSAAAGIESRRAVRRARSQRSPAVRSVRNVAPWKAKMDHDREARDDRVGAEECPRRCPCEVACFRPAHAVEEA